MGDIESLTHHHDSLFTNRLVSNNVAPDFRLRISDRDTPSVEQHGAYMPESTPQSPGTFTVPDEPDERIIACFEDDGIIGKFTIDS